jgi:uncharacterized protein YndB with AHSA1/START domain
MTAPSDESPDARLVRVEVEVPGTPEQVWEAIATGPGLACWFVPAEVDEHEGGAITTHHGPYGDSTGTVTVWDPPHRFAYEERDWQPAEAGAPPWATEILVEARAGGTCIVRLVSGVFSKGDDWADEIDATESGWRQGLENLWLYLTHFPGLRCSSVFAVGKSSTPRSRAWPELTRSLGLQGAAEGRPVTPSPGAPPLAGVVEAVHDETIVVRTDEPAPGIVELSAWESGGATHLTVRGYLYGDRAPPAAAREEPAWRAWLEERFPPAEEAGAQKG